MRLIAGWCVGCLVLSCLSACAFIKPVTEVMFNPATGEMVVRDSKDNSLDIKGLKVLKNPDGTFSLELEQGTFANQSSTVIEANVQQMLAFVEQQKAANEGITAAFAGIAQTLASLAPLVSELRLAVTELRGQVSAGPAGVTATLGPPAPGGQP